MIGHECSTKGTNIQTLVIELLTPWFDDTFSQTLCIHYLYISDYCIFEGALLNCLDVFFPSVTIWRWLPTTERVINRGGARMRQTLMAPANFIFNPPQQSFPEKENIINFYSGCWSIFAKDSIGYSGYNPADWGALVVVAFNLISLIELMSRRQHRIL